MLAGGHLSGFYLIYETFDPSGNSIFPAANGGGIMAYSGPVNQGDIVLLNLYFSDGLVNMYSIDWNTTATAYQSFSDEGATEFLGSSNTSDSNGFFTGLMTEQYHAYPYYGSESKVSLVILILQFHLRSSWIDEWNPTNNQSVFRASSGEITYSNPNLLQSFSSNGATETSNSYDFITGSTGLIGITMRYKVQGGESAYTSPVLTFFSNGFRVTAELSQHPTRYLMDNGSMWAVTNPLTRSTSSERWMSNQMMGGNATNALTETFVYYHQYNVNFGFQTDGGVSIPQDPNVTLVSFGSPSVITATPSGSKMWVDAASYYSYSALSTHLPRKDGLWNQIKREEFQDLVTENPDYRHQFLIVVTLELTGGDSGLPAPIFDFQSLGSSWKLRCN